MDCDYLYFYSHPERILEKPLLVLFGLQVQKVKITRNNQYFNVF